MQAARERGRDAFVRCQATGRPFGVLVVAVDDAALLARVLGDAWVEALVGDLHDRLRDLLAGRAQEIFAQGGRALAYLPDADVARLESVAGELLLGLSGWTAEVAGKPRAVTASLGLASSSAVEPHFDPRLVLEVLEGVAAEGLDVAADGGGGRVVHSELYTFLQRGLERREPGLLDDQARRVADARAAVARVVAPALQSSAPTAPAPSAPAPSAPAPSAPAPSAPARTPAPAPAPTLAPAPIPTSAASETSGGDALRASFGDRLGAAVRELLRGATGGRADPLVERSLGALIEARLEEERRQARAEAERRYGRQVDVLERRLAKLNSALDETERELQRAAFARAADPGAPSAYRDVQGLAADDSQFERKRQLMFEIFSANLDLVRRIAQ